MTIRTSTGSGVLGAWVSSHMEGGGGGNHLRSFIIPCCQIHHSLYSLHRSVEEGVLKMRQHGGHPVHSRREQDPQRDHRRAAAAQPLLRLRLRLVLVGRGVGG